MSRLCLSVAVCCVALGVTSTPASASYHLTRKQAIHALRAYLHGDYPGYYTSVACGPGANPSPLRNGRRHRWSCGWGVFREPTGEEQCGGTASVRGRTGKRSLVKLSNKYGPGCLA